MRGICGNPPHMFLQFFFHFLNAKSVCFFCLLVHLHITCQLATFFFLLKFNAQFFFSEFSLSAGLCSFLNIWKVGWVKQHYFWSGLFRRAQKFAKSWFNFIFAVLESKETLHPFDRTSMPLQTSTACECPSLNIFHTDSYYISKCSM